MRSGPRFLLSVLSVAACCVLPTFGEADAPTANFKADPRLGEVPLVVHFTNDSDGEGPLTFHWDFGDGEQSSEADPGPHTYLVPRDEQYKVTLTVTDSSGRSDKHEVSITVDGPTLLAALLPVSRSVLVGSPATAFATVINAGQVTATGVKIQLDNKTGPGGTALPAEFTYQTTDPSTNALTGLPDAPVDIDPGQRQSFLISVTPSVPLAPTDVQFDIQGTNTTRDARTVIGLNTLLLSASTVATPDVVALAATPDANGILTLAGAPAAGAFSVATVNVGADGAMVASADTGNASLPITLSVCQTKPITGECEFPAAPAVGVQMNQGATSTFAVFVSADGRVLYDPEVNRIFLRFRDASGTVRGATSVAVKGP